MCFPARDRNAHRFGPATFARRSMIGLFLLGGLATTTAAAATQDAARDDGLSTRPLRVHLACADCDMDFIAAEVGFVEFASDSVTVDVAVTVTPEWTDRRWRLVFDGLGRFEARARVLFLSLSAMSTANETRRELARLIRLGLVEYAADTPAGSALDVTFRRAPAAPSTVIVNVDGPAVPETPGDPAGRRPAHPDAGVRPHRRLGADPQPGGAVAARGDRNRVHERAAD